MGQKKMHLLIESAYTTHVLLGACHLSVWHRALDPPITGNSEVWEQWSRKPTALTWLVCSQYCSLDLFLIRGSSSLYTMCSPIVVKMDRPNPMHSSTKSPEKCLMPICKVCDKTGKAMNAMFHVAQCQFTSSFLDSASCFSGTKESWRLFLCVLSELQYWTEGGGRTESLGCYSHINLIVQITPGVVPRPWMLTALLSLRYWEK